MKKNIAFTNADYGNCDLQLVENKKNILNNYGVFFNNLFAEHVEYKIYSYKGLLGTAGFTYFNDKNNIYPRIYINLSTEYKNKLEALGGN